METDRLGEFQYGLSTFVARRAWIQPSHFHLGFVGVNTELRREGNFTLVIPRGDDPDAVKETIRFGSTSPSQVSVQSSPHVDRQFGETGDLQLRQDFEIRLQAASNPGFGECELTVSYMLNGESKQVTVPIDWHVQGDISATPRILLFRLRPSELNVDEFSKTLVVKSRSGMPFSITRTLSPSSAMTVSIQSPTDRPEHDITLNLDPAGVESERRYFEVSFEVSNSSEILRVPVAIIRTPRV